MLLTLLMISFMSALTFVFLKHPLSMGFTLLIQTITTSLIMGFFNLNFWYSYILFLIMIGGMLVLFIYMTSIASNEKFSFSPKILILIMTLMLLTLIMLTTLDPYLYTMQTLNLENLQSSTTYTLSLSKFLNAPLSIIMYMMIIYLLITLVAVVKITDVKKGPLRQTY